MCLYATHMNGLIWDTELIYIPCEIQHYQFIASAMNFSVTALKKTLFVFSYVSCHNTTESVLRSACLHEYKCRYISNIYVRAYI